VASGSLTQEERGRYFVAVSLAEAETLRRIFHVRLGQDIMAEEGKAGGEEGQVALSLRCLPVGNTVFDKSWRMSTASDYNNGVATQALRFINCDMYYGLSDVNQLLHALQSNHRLERRRFFERLLGCRRRLKKKWTDTPVAALFSLSDQWYAFKQRALAALMREIIRQHKGLKVFDACMFIDADKNGLISGAELMGAMVWLNLRVGGGWGGGGVGKILLDHFMLDNCAERDGDGGAGSAAHVRCRQRRQPQLEGVSADAEAQLSQQRCGRRRARKRCWRCWWRWWWWWRAQGPPHAAAGGGALGGGLWNC
jgi:hypothetical protein